MTAAWVRLKGLFAAGMPQSCRTQAKGRAIYQGN